MKNSSFILFIVVALFLVVTFTTCTIYEVEDTTGPDESFYLSSSVAESSPEATIPASSSPEFSPASSSESSPASSPELSETLSASSSQAASSPELSPLLSPELSETLPASSSPELSSPTPNESTGDNFVSSHAEFSSFVQESSQVFVSSENDNSPGLSSEASPFVSPSVGEQSMSEFPSVVSSPSFVGSSDNENSESNVFETSIEEIASSSSAHVEHSVQDSEQVVSSSSHGNEPEYILSVVSHPDRTVDSCTTVQVTATVADIHTGEEVDHKKYTVVEWTVVSLANTTNLTTYLSSMTNSTVSIPPSYLTQGTNYTIQAKVTYEQKEYIESVTFHQIEAVPTVSYTGNTTFEIDYDRTFELTLTKNIPSCINSTQVTWTFNDTSLSELEGFSIKLTYPFFSSKGGVFNLTSVAKYNNKVIFSQHYIIVVKGSSVQISLQASGVTDGVFNRRESLTISSTISPSSVADDIYNYLWTAFTSSGPINLDGKAESINSKHLVVLADKLEPGTLYTFELTIVYQDIEAKEYIKLTSSSPPTISTIIVSPIIGTELTTDFQISFPGWTGASTYTLSYLNSAQEETIIKTDVTSTNGIYTKLPSGTTSLRVVAKTSIGDYGTNNTDVTVNQIESAQLVDTAESTIESLDTEDTESLFKGTSMVFTALLKQASYLKQNPAALHKAQAVLASALSKILTNLKNRFSSRRSISATTLTKSDMTQSVSALLTSVEVQELITTDIATIIVQAIQTLTSTVSVDSDVYATSEFIDDFMSVAGSLALAFPDNITQFVYPIIEPVSATQLKYSTSGQQNNYVNQKFAVSLRHTTDKSGATVTLTPTGASPATVVVSDVSQNSALSAYSDLLLNIEYYPTSPYAPYSKAVSGVVVPKIQQVSNNQVITVSVSQQNVLQVTVPLYSVALEEEDLACRTWNTQSQQWTKSSACTIQKSGTSSVVCTCSEITSVVVTDETIADKPSSGLAGGAIAGIIIGIVAAIVIVLLIAIVIIAVVLVRRSYVQKTTYVKRARTEKLMTSYVDAPEFHELNDV
jgi:uncharacterized membrane protein